MIRESDNDQAARQLAHILRGLTPAERLAVLSMWALNQIQSRQAFTLRQIESVTGLEEVENCKACLLVLLRGFLVAGPGPWDFTLDAEKLPW
jgi:hypothetical protein